MSSAPQPSATETATPGGLRDRYGRVAQDLRVSLTDRCNLRCTYCMPAEGLPWIPTPEHLTDTELLRLIEISVTQLGIRKVRFTGGEPLLRKNLAEIIHRTAALRTADGSKISTAITTNGVSLARHAPELAHAGLDRVNISLDSLDAERYSRITRRNRISDVLAGIAAAQQVQLTPIKINTVIMPGVNEQDIIPLAEFCLRNNLQLRFIEHMPLGPRETWNPATMVTAADILQVLSEQFTMSPLETADTSAPAELWHATSTHDPKLNGTIGVIAAVTQPFCGKCDRTRLTSDGMIRSCLFSHSETDLKSLLRSGASDAEIAQAWSITMWNKPAGHGINDPGFLQPKRTMSAIGG
ncbi:MAG: GTP 3',8-cyclase MoaA [Corynebacterium sp.]|nr:GTP 3',8-cyclase MoaA [Corynebacterium sp.]